MNFRPRAIAAGEGGTLTFDFALLLGVVVSGVDEAGGVVTPVPPCVLKKTARKAMTPTTKTAALIQSPRRWARGDENNPDRKRGEAAGLSVFALMNSWTQTTREKLGLR